MKKKALLGFLFVCCLLLASVTVFPGAAEADNLGWELSEQIGGTTKAMLLEGNTLYLGTGLHVMILDVENPKEIRVLGTSPILPDFVESIADGGDGRLYVCCGLGGLVVLDATDPGSPRITAIVDTPGYAENAAATGEYLLLADGPQGLQIYRMQDDDALVKVAEAYASAYAYDVAVLGGTAYVAGGGSGLFAVDVSDPVAPEEIGLFPAEGFQYDAEIRNGRLYLASAWGGVSVFDLQTPRSPVQVQTIPTDGWAMTLQTLEDGLLVADGADGLMRFSLTGDRAHLAASYYTGGFALCGACNDGASFLVDREKGLLTFDSALGGLKLVSRWMPILDGRRVTISGSTAYVAAGLSGLHALDISDPARCSDVYWYDTGSGYANKVIVSGTTAYMSSHLSTQNPLVIFDVGNPLKPMKTGAVPNDATVFNTGFRSMALGNGVIYIPGESCDMSIDVSNPSSPKVLNRCDLENPINADVSGDLLVTLNNYQIQLIDVSHPNNMNPYSFYTSTTSGEAVRFLDADTVMVSGDEGVIVLDVSNPVKPKKLAGVALPSSAMDIDVEGDYAYICTLGSGVQIVDISKPSKPALKGSFTTVGVAYDCCVQGDTLLVADSFGGVSVYRRNAETQGEAAQAANEAEMLPVLVSQAALANVDRPPEFDGSQNDIGTVKEVLVTSRADSGPGTLREALSNLRENTVITFDPAVFPPEAPATILLTSALPEIAASFVTIDASNAGVILDGSGVPQGSGLKLSSFHGTVMGLQTLRFPQFGIEVEGAYNQIGGNRNIGDGPAGQGNVCSGNGLYGIRVGGWYNTVLGNLTGTDSTGTKPLPNRDGIFVADFGHYATIGGTEPGEGNVISGNSGVNIDTWGDHTRIIGNLIGLDITGARAMDSSIRQNLVMESNCLNNTVGGTGAGERNVIGGARIGVTFSDPNSYQNTVRGNYIGTDVTGTKAIPNETGILLWTSGNHLVGGTEAGAGNLISGNLIGIQFNGYGVADNLVLGNRFGLNADGGSLPNSVDVDINMGQHHGVIGGYTRAEGNLFSGGDIAIRIADLGIRSFYIGGNTFADGTATGVSIGNGASGNFVVGNTFGMVKNYAIEVQTGTGNLLDANVFSAKAKGLIRLYDNGNTELAAPKVKTAKGDTVSGTACANGRVEIYAVGQDTITLIGSTIADGKGRFTYADADTLAGKKIVLLAIDPEGNTSAFSKSCTVKK